MFLFKNHSSWFVSDDPQLTGHHYRAHWLQEFLSGTEKARDMLIGLTILVLLLHIWPISWLKSREPKPVPLPPQIIEMNLITPPKPPQPVETPPAPPKPPEKKITPPKPLPQKPVVERKPTPPKPQPVVRPVEPDPAPADGLPAIVPVPPSPPAPPVHSSSSASSSHTETFVEPNYKANYASNPKPEYPRIAKSRGWEGVVKLKVLVSVTGHAKSVEIQSSSGHEVLDESALDAVKQWKFIPAKRGDTPVESSVIVPINFKLDSDDEN